MAVRTNKGIAVAIEHVPEGGEGDILQIGADLWNALVPTLLRAVSALLRAVCAFWRALSVSLGIWSDTLFLVVLTRPDACAWMAPETVAGWAISAMLSAINQAPCVLGARCYLGSDDKS